jgi:predicted DNA-binding protein
MLVRIPAEMSEKLADLSRREGEPISTITRFCSKAQSSAPPAASRC